MDRAGGADDENDDTADVPSGQAEAPEKDREASGSEVEEAEGDVGVSGRDTEGRAAEPTELAGPQGREAAIAARESLSSTERERVETTVSELLDLLGKAHTMAILRVFAFSTEPWRFTELEAELGIAPNTLSGRLKELVAAGLLVRRSYDEIPPRVEYEATERAADLFPAFGHFHRWARTHDLAPVDDGDDPTE